MRRPGAVVGEFVRTLNELLTGEQAMGSRLVRCIDPLLAAALAAGGLVAAGCSESPGVTFDAAVRIDSADKPDGGANPTMLPFAVDDWYAPSGYMGDGESPGGVTDKPVCASPRPAGWLGHCHRFTWTPGAKKWAGVYWQYPDGNWGDAMGLSLPAGATKVSFQAWGQTGGEIVSFLVGMKAVDGFALTMDKVVLTTTPQEYDIDLTTTTYAKVVGGFGWSAGDSSSAVVFNIDDIRWQ
jgi:hypothetical protein